MGTYAAVAHTTWVDGYDMTTDTNQTKLSIKREVRDSTTFGATAAARTARSRTAGLETVDSSVRGLVQYGTGTVDPQIFSNLGSRHVVTQTPDGAEGSRAYFYQAMDPDYTMPWKLGDLAMFDLSMQGTRGSGTLSAGAIAGYVAKAKGDVSATGALGTYKQLGAVSATQYLYAAVHIFAAGTTITILVESDDNTSFTSPTTVATIGPLTAVGGTWLARVAGPITDTYWRLNVSAITGTFNLAASFGVK